MGFFCATAALTAPLYSHLMNRYASSTTIKYFLLAYITLVSYVRVGILVHSTRRLSIQVFTKLEKTYFAKITNNLRTLGR